MGIIEQVSSSLGRAVGSFQRAFDGARGNARRPRFLTAFADSLRWSGGDLGMMDAAQQRAIQNAWLYTAISMLEREISAASIQVEAVIPGKGRELIPEHPLEIVLMRPNPVMGQAFLWQFTASWLYLDGNAYWFLAPDASGNLAEIWPLPANAVEPVPGDNERFVDHYEFVANGQVFNIPAEYICHIMFPNPHDMFRGLSPLVAGMLPVDADSSMARWNGAFFGQQNVMPSALINVASGDATAPIDQTDIDQITDKLRNDYAAIERKTVVTNAPGGIDVKLLGWSAKDMDFLEGRRFTRDEIFAIYGIPGGLLDKSATEANAQTADRIFKEKTIWPTLVLMSEQITAQIVHRFYGSNLEATFKDIRPTNRAMELEELRASIGLVLIDEARTKYLKLPPLSDGRGQAFYTAAAPADPAALFSLPTSPMPAPEQPLIAGQAGTEQSFPAPEERKPENPINAERIPQKAVGHYSSAMLALYVPLNRAYALEINPIQLPPGSETQDPEYMHITVAYFCDDIAATQVIPENLVDLLKPVAEQFSPITARVGGLGNFFSAEWDDGKNAFIAMIDSAEVGLLHEAVKPVLSAVGLPASERHGYTPHITLAYVPEDAIHLPQIDFSGIEITFTHLTLAWGNRLYTIPFGARPESIVEPDVIAEPTVTLVNPAGATPDRFAKAAYQAELKRWQTKAQRALKDGKPALVQFSSDILDSEITSHITAGLEAAETAEDVKALFASVDLGTQVSSETDALLLLAAEIRAAREALGQEVQNVRERSEIDPE